MASLMQVKNSYAERGILGKNMKMCYVFSVVQVMNAFCCIHLLFVQAV